MFAWLKVSRACHSHVESLRTRCEAMMKGRPKEKKSGEQWQPSFICPLSSVREGSGELAWMREEVLCTVAPACDPGVVGDPAAREYDGQHCCEHD